MQKAGNRMRKLTPLLLLLIALPFVVQVSLRAQTVDLDKDRLPIAQLPVLWRFHTGDNPAWADPRFDDSNWSLLRSDMGWSSQGYKNYSGMAWYRFKVTIPADLDHVSLYLPHIYTCYEVYADGSLIGTYGDMPPHAHRYDGGGKFQVHPLPAGPRANREIEIAIRVWHSPAWANYTSGGPDHGGGLIGESSQIAQQNNGDRINLLWSMAGEQILALLETLAGLCALALFLLRRNEPEYLWFGLMALFGAASDWIILSGAMQLWNVELFDASNDISVVGFNLAAVAFYRRLFRPKSRLFLIAAIGSTFLSWLGETLFHLLGSYPGVWAPSLLQTVTMFVFYLWVISVVVTGALKGSPEARLLLIPTLLLSALFEVNFAVWTSYTLGWQHRFDGSFEVTVWPFSIQFLQLAMLAFLLSVLAILFLRFSRTRSQEERYASEFESARSVQQYLIPDQLPPTPGLTIESAYRPAREVGGDFFQVLPSGTDGTVLIVVGDVAGKGLQAGMLSALIVGAIRTAAAFTCDPAKIIALLNERLQGRGLVTCLALSIKSDGAATLVNAGHLPPYLDGQELPMEGALPLGAISGIDFPVLNFQLAAGDSLILMSDGIAEAQKPDGELFGFDRISELLSRTTSAATLADAAQSFGQEDDITVLTIARTHRTAVA